MKKAKIILTCEVEIPLNPEYYPDGSTPQQMIDMELENLCAEDIISLTNTNIDIKGELIE